MVHVEQEASPLSIELAKAVRLADDIITLFNLAKKGGIQKTVSSEIIDGLNSAKHYCLQKVPSIVFLDLPKTESVEVIKSPKQEESTQDYMKKIGFEPGQVSYWEIKQDMILEALARHNRALFERELGRISDLRGGFFEDLTSNRLIELTAMATFAQAGRAHRNG